MLGLLKVLVGSWEFLYNFKYILIAVLLRYGSYNHKIHPLKMYDLVVF